MALRVENILFTSAMILYFACMVLFFVFFAMKREKAGKYAQVLLGVTFVLHTAALIARWIGAGRLPLTNQYEFATSFAWGICLVCLIFMYRYGFRVLGTFTAPVIFLIIGYAAMQNKEVKELMPALRSNWLAFHVSTAIISYGAFGVSFAVSLIFLVRERMKKPVFVPEQAPDGSTKKASGNIESKNIESKNIESKNKTSFRKENAFWDTHIPSAQKLDQISYRAVSLGFLFLTFVIVSGSIWAERAWGSYWSWDPKETWSLVTWIIYALYLHLRIARKWKNRAAAVFAVIGFLCVIFTYIGVNTFLPGIHSYA